jgi:ketosteroid isomerase-like protein
MATLILLTLLALSALALLWLWQRASNSQTGDAAEQSQAQQPEAEQPAATSPETTSSPDGNAIVTESADDSPRASETDALASNTPPPVRRSSDAEAMALRKNLDEWIAATNDADLDSQLRFYAPALERYYLRTNFSRDSVREDKARLTKRGRLTGVRAEAPEINISPDNQIATMRFRKDYGFEGSASRNAVMQELRWRKTEDGWRIISERDLRVLQ